MWQSRLSGRAKTAFIVGPLVAIRLARVEAGNPIVIALVVMWLAFVALTWLGPPVANLALRLSPRGRAILPAAQKRSSSMFAALVAGAVLAVALALVVGEPFAETALALGLLALSAGSYHGLSPARRRVLVVVIGAAAGAAFLGATLVSVGVDAGALLLIAAVIAGVALLWFVRFS
jgi:hypothetical protein